MTASSNPKLQKVYTANSDEERRAAYDAWSNDYDKDVLSFGIRLPFISAAVFARHVERGRGTILDAGCGTGMHTEPLYFSGYKPFLGIDISEGMIEAAREKNMYQNLEQVPLGPDLPFPDETFSDAYCIGTLAPGHAPPSSLRELCRVTRPGGKIVFSTRMDAASGQDTFQAQQDALVREGIWKKIYQTEPFVSMPAGDPSVLHSVFVYEVMK